MLLEGSTVLAFAHGKNVHLKPGDYVNIPKGIQHRVNSTAENQDTIWLAVFYQD